MNLSELPVELLLKIFEYTGNLKVMSLVCKDWKLLIDEHVVFGKLKFTESSVNDMDWIYIDRPAPGKKLESDEKPKECDKFQAILQTKRKFECLQVKIGTESSKYLVEFLKSSPKVENIEIYFNRNVPDFEDLHNLIDLLKNFKSVSILTDFSVKKILQKSRNDEISTISLPNLKNFKIVHQNVHSEYCDAILNFMETPNLEKFTLKSRRSYLPELENCLKFVNKWTKVNLKFIDVACLIVTGRNWLELHWSDDTLKMSESKHPMISKQFSEFLENHQQKFKKLKQLSLNRCGLPTEKLDLIWTNAINLAQISTDMMIPIGECKQKVYFNMKNLKIFDFNYVDGFEAVESLNKSFPNLESLLFCREISDDLRQLIGNNFRNLREFKDNMEMFDFYQAEPEDEKIFKF